TDKIATGTIQPDDLAFSVVPLQAFDQKTSDPVHEDNQVANPGYALSSTMGSDGLPGILYATTGKQIAYSHCLDPACGNRSDIFTSYSSLSNPAIQVTTGSDGNPVFVISDSTLGHVEVGHCNTVDCTDSIDTNVVYNGDWSGSVSITIGTDGNPNVGWY